MEYYELIKTLHLISIILWVSALIYFPRLLSHHLYALQMQNDDLVQKIKKEEKIIYMYVMTLSFLFALAFGVYMISVDKTLLSSGIWIYLKFFFISLLAIINHIYKIYMKELDKNLSDIQVNQNMFTYLSYACIIMVSIICFLTILKMI